MKTCLTVEGSVVAYSFILFNRVLLVYYIDLIEHVL